MEEGFEALTNRLGAGLSARGWRLACAESCTGGLLSSVLTDAPGASAWFSGAVVAYANEVKRDVLGVSQQILDVKGAVSREAVLAMVRGARGVLRADIAVAVSGIAGPAGGTPQKPVGTVWMAWESPDAVEVKRFVFQGDRSAVKRQSVAEAMAGVAAMAMRPTNGSRPKTAAPGGDREAIPATEDAGADAKAAAGRASGDGPAAAALRGGKIGPLRP